MESRGAILRHSLACLGVFAVTSLAAPTSSEACGLTPPIGPNGLPATCHGDDAEVRLRAGLVVGGTSTRIDFREQASLLQAATGATLDVMPLERLTLSGSLGASLPGRVRYQSLDYELRPGPMAGVGVAYRFLGGRLPFIHGSLTLSWSRSVTRAPDGEDKGSFTSRDYRLGLAIGKTLGRFTAPFVVARYFGAGTDWSFAGHGVDHYQFQIGAGSAFALGAHWDALVELAFLGEKRAAVGAGYSF